MRRVVGLLGDPTSLGANGLAAAPVILAGSEETDRHYLGMLTEASKLASFCLTEPDAGSDVSGMRTRAVRKGDTYVLNDQKCFITNGGHADWFTVYAETEPEAGAAGSAFVVDRDDTVVVDKKEDKMGQRASNTATIAFNDTEAPAANLLGQENHGFKIAMGVLDRTRPGVAAMAVGIAQRRLRARRRLLQGARPVRRPDRHAPGDRLHDAGMAADIEAARLLTRQSAVVLDQGGRNTLQSSHAKRFAADAEMRITTDAVQVYGGYGFIRDCPVEKLMRDAKIMRLSEGTSQIQRLVIARETLMPRETAPAAVAA